MAIRFDQTDLPVPPSELIQRVVPPFAADAGSGEQAAFDFGGQHSLRCLENGLGAVGRDWSEYRRVLDFGCGPGRILRWMEPLAATAELHGIDIDADAVAWAAANLPHATFTTGPHEPPAPYPAGHFDLVINHSVFTHLDERMQDLWLAELQRITAPGATLLLTAHSANQVRAFYEGLQGAGVDPEPYRAQLETAGILFVREDHYIGSTHPSFYHSTFHTPWYLFEHWHRFFEIRAYLPHGGDTQDLLVLERRPDGAAVPEPVGHRGGGAGSDTLRGGLQALANQAVARVGRRLARADGAANAEARRLLVLESSLQNQAERITLIQRDLRRELDELRDDRA